MVATLARPAVSRRPRSKTRDLRFTIAIKAKPEQIYRALTSATELCRWWLQGAETDARNAGRLRMVWPKIKARDGSGEKLRAFPAHVASGDSEGYFVDLEPGRKVAWLWKLRKHALYPPLATFFIEKKSRGCELTLVHSGFSSKPSYDKVYAGSIEGWEDCLAKLKLYLETGRTCKSQALNFAQLREMAK